MSASNSQVADRAVEDAALTQARASKIAQVTGLLREIAEQWTPVSLASSFGAEDMVLIDLIARHAPAIGVFTLDTGRLPQETYDLIEQMRNRYDLVPAVFAPDAAALAAHVEANGPNAFRRSVELRRACCGVRKVEPLARALAGQRAWITGQRREQSVTRAGLELVEDDATHGLRKFNPLVDWTHGDVWAYIERFDVPHNALHRQGYPSIGCAPCTRAIAPGEDERAGRWWWENPEHKECGLHVHAVADTGPAGPITRTQYATWKPR